MSELPSPAKGQTSQRPFQFSLRHALLGVTAVSVLLGLYTWFGVIPPLALLALGMVALAMFRREFATVAGVLIGACVLAGMLLPAVGTFPPAKRFVCNCNLRQIGLALHSYHELYGSFPPAFIADERGRPMHSWRTLILPQLEHQPLFDSLYLDQPCDDPRNLKLASTNLGCYRCPSDKSNGPGCTSYLAIVGPGTAWPGAKPASLDDFTDGRSNTILVVEVAGSNIPWSQPRDIAIGNLDPRINSQKKPGISSNHKGGANVLFADGHVEFVSSDLLPREVQAMLTAHAGDATSPH
jgi:prepilin-type processing-associated H-X9-DG protein